MKKTEKPKQEIATYTVEYWKKDGYEPKRMTCDEVNKYVKTSKRRYRVRNNKTGQIVMTKMYKG